MPDDAREIENLLYTYAERIDAGDLEGVADLFAHGRIAPSPETPDDQAIVGRDAVFRLYEATVKMYEDGPRTKHVTTNAIIEAAADGDAATSRSYYTVFQKVDDHPLEPIVAGRYHDTFQRVDGRWWFDTRTIFVDQVGDLSRHLLYQL